MKQGVMLFMGALLLPAAFAVAQEAPRPELQKLFLYRVQPVRADLLKRAPTPEESKVLDQHLNYLKDLTSKGVVLLVGRTLNTDQSSFGIIIFHAVSEEAARQIMEDDPAIEKGVFHAKLFPFQVVLAESAQGQ